MIDATAPLPRRPEPVPAVHVLADEYPDLPRDVVRRAVERGYRAAWVLGTETDDARHRLAETLARDRLDVARRRGEAAARAQAQPTQPQPAGPLSLE